MYLAEIRNTGIKKRLDALEYRAHQEQNLNWMKIIPISTDRRYMTKLYEMNIVWKNKEKELSDIAD